MESQAPPGVPEEAVVLPVENSGVPKDDTQKDQDISPLPHINVASPSIDEVSPEQVAEALGISSDVSIPERDASELREELAADEQTDGSVMDVDGTVDAESPKEDDDDDDDDDDVDDNRVFSPPATTTSRRRESKAF